MLYNIKTAIVYVRNTNYLCRSIQPICICIALICNQSHYKKYLMKHIFMFFLGLMSSAIASLATAQVSRIVLLPIV